MMPQNSQTKPEIVRSLSYIPAHLATSRPQGPGTPTPTALKENRSGKESRTSYSVRVIQDLQGKQWGWGTKLPKGNNEIHLFVNSTKLSSLQITSFLESHMIPIKQMSYRPLLLSSKLSTILKKGSIPAPFKLCHVEL
jgi:hypothetical protein